MRVTLVTVNVKYIYQITSKQDISLHLQQTRNL